MSLTFGSATLSSLFTRVKSRYFVGRCISCRVTFVCAIGAWVTVHACMARIPRSLSAFFPSLLLSQGIVAKIAHTHSLFAVHRRPTDAFGSGGFCCRTLRRRSLATIRERSSSFWYARRRRRPQPDRRHFHSFPSLSNFDDKCRHRLHSERPPQAIVSLYRTHYRCRIHFAASMILFVPATKRRRG